MGTGTISAKLDSQTVNKSVTIDTIAPILTSIKPVNGATNVAQNIIITITFSEPIKKASNCWVELKSSNGTIIPITTSVSGNVLTINHSALLAPNTKYTLVLHTGCVTDLAGNPLTLCTRTFTTAST